MKLLKFRIRNYKSIVDSGDCYFSEKLTILAGKNESGKTTILEALEDFHEDREIRKEAQTIGSKLRPEVIVTFRLTKGEVNW
jgi:AAA15 family ATPase/GTPase